MAADGLPFFRQTGKMGANLDGSAGGSRIGLNPEYASHGIGCSAPAGAARAVDFSYGFYYAYLGGLGISVALAGWTVYTIVRYVRAADRSGGQGVVP